jgi:hypothetical protein
MDIGDYDRSTPIDFLEANCVFTLILLSDTHTALAGYTAVFFVEDDELGAIVEGTFNFCTSYEEER